MSLLMWCNLIKVSEYSFKQNRSILKNMTVLLYTYFLISPQMYQDEPFLIYVICLFYAVQILVKLGSKLCQKLTTFPTLWALAPTELQFSVILFYWYIANQETNKAAWNFFRLKYFLNNQLLIIFMETALSKLAKLLL